MNERRNRLQKPRGCRMCGDMDCTTGSNYGDRRRVDVPGERWVHFSCLGDWLIDRAMDDWFGSMGGNARKAFLTRLGLPQPERRPLSTLNQVAREHKYTGAWLSTQVQRPAMAKFDKRVIKANERPDRDKRDRIERAEIRQLAEKIVDLTNG